MHKIIYALLAISTSVLQSCVPPYTPDEHSLPTSTFAENLYSNGDFYSQWLTYLDTTQPESNHLNGKKAIKLVRHVAVKIKANEKSEEEKKSKSS